MKLNRPITIYFKGSKPTTFEEMNDDLMTGFISACSTGYVLNFYFSEMDLIDNADIVADYLLDGNYEENIYVAGKYPMNFRSVQIQKFINHLICILEKDDDRAIRLKLKYGK